MAPPANIPHIRHRCPFQRKPSLSIIWLFSLFLCSALHPGQLKSLHAESHYQDTGHITQDVGARQNALNTVSSPQCNLLGRNLNDLIGSRDAAILADPQGKIVFSKNADKNLIPASVLKILTALVALHYLGPDYRFKTEFYLDGDGNLKIKGYGDPLLTSEVLAQISKGLGERLIQINNLILDDSYFKQPLIIPEIASSTEPYTAPNGALCVNFNTVYFKSAHNGSYISGEPQTPLLPFALKKIKASGLQEGRITLSHQKKDMVLYAGQLLLYFMEKEGIQLNGGIRTGMVLKEKDKCIFTYIAKFSLEQVIANLLEYSNNFMANQLLIAAGAKAYGPPGTLEKGVRAAVTYARNILKIENICIVEGSGIAKKNRMSATHLYKILGKFEPYSLLMRKKGTEFYKTGTLNGIRTRAGYIKKGKEELYRFVVLINTPGKSTESIMEQLRQSAPLKQ